MDNSEILLSSRLPATKDNLRKLFGERNTKLKVEDIESKSHRILSHFSEICISELHLISTFIPAKRLKEPDTFLIVDDLSAKFPGLVITVPVIGELGYTMENVVLKRDVEFKKNNFGIPEPKKQEVVMPELIDLVLIPMLCFDESGNRVGHGRGYYDRYLKRCRPDVVKVGICLFEPVERIEDVGRNDVALDFCCTPEKLYSWK